MHEWVVTTTVELRESVTGEVVWSISERVKATAADNPTYRANQVAQNVDLVSRQIIEDAVGRWPGVEVRARS